MAAIRRHWKTLVFLQAMVLLALAGGVYYFTPGPVHAQQQPPAPPPAPAPLVTPEDRGSYVRIQALRRQLQLENYDLAAVGCDGAKASEVLGALVSWYQANADALDRAQTARTIARRELQETIRKINVGPKNDAVIASVPTLQQHVVATDAAHETILADAAAAVSTKLTSAQQAVWARGRANVGLPLRYRYLSNLTAAQVGAIAKGRGQDAALQRSEESLLSASQQGELSEAQTNVQAHVSDVSLVAAQLLPGPPPLPQPTSRPGLPGH